MIVDIFTVAKKELLEVMVYPGWKKSGGLFAVVLALGWFLPRALGETWLGSGLMLFLWGWLPFVLVSSVAADTIAGERERGTLEPLLASRLSWRAIFFGKIVGIVLYSYTIILVLILMGLVSVNLVLEGRWQGFSITYGSAVIGISLFSSVVFACFGVIVSCEAKTVKQAQQVMARSPILIGIMLAAVIFILPNDLEDLIWEWVAGLKEVHAMLLAAGVSLLVSLGLVIFALGRYGRDGIRLK